MGRNGMEYRILGKTGLRVSILSYGASPLGDVFGTTDVKEIHAAVHFAIDQGINYFDVSPYYGKDALAEQRLGEALDNGWRKKIILATKAGQYSGSGAAHDYSAKRITASIEESLKRLRTDYVDIYQVHDIHFTTAAQVVNETLPAMLKLKQQGKVRHIGITDYHLDRLKAVAEQADLDTVLTFCCYNLVDTSFDTVLAPVAKARNLGVINASPLHMGLLVPKQKRLAGQSPVNALSRAVAEAARYCEENGTTIDDLAMRFAYAYKGVATTLCGMSRRKSVERNLAAVGESLDAALVSRVVQIISEGYDPAHDPFGLTDERRRENEGGLR